MVSISQDFLVKLKEKMKHITGSEKPPAEDDLKYKSWEAENSIVMSWLLHSMQPEISKKYLLLPTAKDI